MSYFTSILFYLSSTLFMACGSSNSSFTKKKTNYKDISLIAWNEDTTNSYQLVLTKSNKFHYTIINNDGKKSEENYSGTFSNQPSLDTIFLKYNKKIKPIGVTSYFLKEVSGRYLIQPFETNTKRIFLRVQQFGHRF